MTQFVNPYTFVPHVDAPVRDEPAGHAKMEAGRLSGVLRVTVTAHSPLVIGGGEKDGAGVHRAPRRKKPANRPMIPGSGFLGAVRSVHEALAGGCLRVLNTDWVAVHRHPASPSVTKDLRLAVVTDVSTGDTAEKSQVRVAVCDEWMMIPVKLLPGATGGLPRTGDQLQYRPDGTEAAHFPEAAVTKDTKDYDRQVLNARSEAYLDGVAEGSIQLLSRMGRVTQDCWVLLVTDTKARDRDPLRFAAGRLGPDSRSYVIPDGTLERYRQTVAGADDLRTATLADDGIDGGGEPPYDPGKPEYHEVTWPSEGGKPVAERLRARTYFHVGQPVWVKFTAFGDETDQISEIRLSRLWRYQGKGPVGERVGQAGPCREPGHLCWSCRVFGSADTEGRGKNDLAVQRGYRGHVRFDDLLADSDFTGPTWHLAPLSSPSPSAGQFYLDNSKLTSPAQRVAAKNAEPLAAWGSAADKPANRQIRGRKFYWRTTADPARPHARGERRKDQSRKLSKQVELIPAGTVFRGRIRFDNLSVEDYGSLLAALDPRLLDAAGDPAWRETVTSVGGGKPFGFGSVHVDVRPEEVADARMRYLGETGRVPGPDEAVRAFAASVPKPAYAQWERLRHVLSPEYVDDDLVWYPPGPGAKGDKTFDESFEFFALTNGVELRKERRVLVDLPDPAKAPEAQVLDSPAHGSDPTNGREQRRQRDQRGGRG
ncbi:TIGR03986 family CRISPR-associated RAMP protein [Trebonia sp.]|uniref:TIGR03986 family type III CRISPR-associated RAMP protein n=1 Tax=Trebonia sp. TaxID=2767075 RepID=UPI00262D3D62|nr:TIGR03986 family CRISPR-associated RAMP protein [Trebonia sp.]